MSRAHQFELFTLNSPLCIFFCFWSKAFPQKDIYFVKGLIWITPKKIKFFFTFFFSTRGVLFLSMLSCVLCNPRQTDWFINKDSRRYRSILELTSPERVVMFQPGNNSAINKRHKYYINIIRQWRIQGGVRAPCPPPLGLKYLDFYSK